MGRPIKSKYFGTQKGAGTGGEGVSLVTITSAGSGLTGTNTVVFSAPDLPGGTAATGEVVVVGTTVTEVTIVSAGSGYLTAPTVSFASSTGTTATATATLTTTVGDIIKANAYIPGGSAASVADIDEQVASKKYRVQTADGTGVVKLVTTLTSSLAEGEMNIMATDTNGSTYWVKKLTARRAVVAQLTASTAFIFEDGASVGWNLDAANSTDVLIDNH